MITELFTIFTAFFSLSISVAALLKQVMATTRPESARKP